jgi:glycosyltransferase involved in cell wall biosynthesis
VSAGGRHLGYVLKRFPRISETFIAAELIELRRQGERVTVFAISRPAEAFTHGFLDDLDVTVVYLPYRPAGEPRRTGAAVLRAWRRNRRGCFAAAGAAFRRPTPKSVRRLLQAVVLVEELERAGVTHVHAHFASTAARLANLAWRLGGPPYSVTAHAKDIWHREARPDALRDKLGSARFVATVSQENHRHLEAVLGGRGRVRVVPNSVDLARLPDPADRLPEPGVVLSVARLVEKKGLEDLVRACGRLHRDGCGCPIRLRVIGDGPRRTALAELAALEGITVDWLGALPHEQVAEHYRRAAVFVLPCVVAATGDRDGLPTSVLEAMAAGLPVVTTAVNGLADAVVDGVTGLIVDQHDPSGLAAAIRRLLEDPALGSSLGRAAHWRVAEQFSLARSTGALRALFDGAA